MTPNRMRGALAPLLLCLLVGSAHADGEPEPVPGQNEPVGTWRFRTDRPLKAVIVGGSVAAFDPGNFGKVLQEACSNAEVVNIAKARYGAWAMKRRFEAQVLKNRNLKTAKGDLWVVILGGLNSVGSPQKTNSELLQIIQSARGAKMKVVGLSLSPWGSESDSRRWEGTAGLTYRRHTQKVVDFLMGRLAPAAALGRYGKDKATWEDGDLPDISVDLYDSPLRDATAPLRPRAAMERAVDRSPAIKKELAALPEAERAAARERLIAEAQEIPRWYLRKELQSFDNIHPNREGHRLIAAEACQKLPSAWGCDCGIVAAKAPKADSKAGGAASTGASAR